MDSPGHERVHVELLGESEAARRPSAVESPGAVLPGGRSSASSSIVIGRYQGTVLVTVHGELDIARAAHLGRVLADLIDGQGNLSVVVDLHDATAVDADSLSVFAEAAERAHRRGGTMRLSEPPAALHRALELRGLDEFIGTEPRTRRPNA